MQTINILKAEIKDFIIESQKQYNLNEQINRRIYFELIDRINNLKIEDFDSIDKFEYFLTYWNQDIRSAGRFLISTSFEEEFIDLNSFLTISNDFSGLLNWLK